MSDLKLYLREAIAPGAADLIYLSRPDGEADGKCSLQDAGPALAGVLSPSFAAAAHGHAAGDVSGLAAVATSGAYGDLLFSPALGSAAAFDADTDPALGSSNGKLPSQLAVKTYVDGAVSAAALPSQTGQTGKFLTTNGTAASWGTPSGSGTVTSVSGNRGLTGTVTGSGNIGINVAGTTAGQVLTSTGPSSDPTFQAPAMVLIGRVTTSGGQTSIDFSSIPGGCKTLKLIGNLRTGSTDGPILAQFNGDTNKNNYSSVQNQATGSGNNSQAFAAGNTFANLMFNASASSATTALVEAAEATIPNYSSTTFDKAYVSTGGSAAVAKLVTGIWFNTAAINRITLVTQNGQAFANGLEWSLYGLS